MHVAHLDYLKEKGLTWFNPCYGLSEFWNIYRKLATKLGPNKDPWNHRELKRAKEIYATCIVAKIFEQQEQVGPWWVIKPKNDPPDGVIGAILEKGGIKKMYVREIEVVEHLKGDLVNTIKEKLNHKAYEANTVLVCFISRGGVYDFENEAKTIHREVIGLEHIFFVFLGTKLSELPQELNTDVSTLRKLVRVSLVQVKPVFTFLSLDPIEVCTDWRNGKEMNFFIFDGYGKGDQRRITLKDPPKLF